MLATPRIAFRFRSPFPKSQLPKRSCIAGATTTRIPRRPSPALPPSSTVPPTAQPRIAKPLTTRNVPTSERSIKRELDQLRYDRWGFFIYRTSYDDDQSWNGFKEIITANAAQQIKRSDAPEIARKLTWTFFDDHAAFQGASKADLRAHFNRWAKDNWQLEQPRAEDPKTPRYRYFVEVDRGVLDSMPEMLDERTLMDVSHVNFVDAQWRPLSERAPDEPQEELEAIEGVTDEDVGWLELRAYLIGSDTCRTRPL